MDSDTAASRLPANTHWSWKMASPVSRCAGRASALSSRRQGSLGTMIVVTVTVSPSLRHYLVTRHLLRILRKLLYALKLVPHIDPSVPQPVFTIIEEAPTSN